MKIRGFTLIELLIVISILAILAGMAFPLVGMARERARETNARALLATVETAVELFNGEVNTYPYMRHDPSMTFSGAGNGLARRLAVNFWDHDSADVADFWADIATVQAAYGQTGGQRVAAAAIGAPVGDEQTTHLGLVNRMASERASLSVMAGNQAIERLGGGATFHSCRGFGYTFDFLSADLSKDDMDGNDIIDPWGNPIIYNCPVVKGVTRVSLNALSQGDGELSLPVASDWRSIDPTVYGLESNGRILTEDLAEDQRTHASIRFVYRYELWSAGPNGVIEGRRNAAENKDNISAQDYDEGME